MRTENLYALTGLQIPQSVEVLGVSIPMMELPVRPGRSLATIVEISARNWRLRAEGYNAADELDRRLALHYQRMNKDKP